MFWFKKIVSKFLFPIPLSLEILLLGLIMLCFTSRKKLGKAFIALGIVLLAGLSFTPLSDMLLAPLEYKYPSLENLEACPEVKWIVVLGGGHKYDPRTPVTARPNQATMIRLVEAIRLHRLLPQTKLILCEGGPNNQVKGARLMADVALALGVDGKDIILDSVSRDTKDQARLVKKMIGRDRLILITSAAHMPRAMALFKKLDMQPVPAPTDHLYNKDPAGRSFSDYFPNAKAALKSKIAFHEYLGLAWAKIRGQI